MTAFTADLDALHEATDRMVAFERQLDEWLQELDARACRVRAGWSGSAGERYDQAHRAWSRGAHDAHGALGELRRIVATAHGNYSAAVRANLSMWP